MSTEYTSLVNLMMQSGKTFQELSRCGTGIVLRPYQDKKLFEGFLKEFEEVFSAWYKMRWHVQNDWFNVSPKQTTQSETFKVTYDPWHGTKYGLKINDLCIKLEEIQMIQIQWGGSGTWDMQICLNDFREDGINPTRGTWFSFAMVSVEHDAIKEYWERLETALLQRA